MKKTLASLAIVILSFALQSQQSGNVYVCMGPKATVYHSKSNCSGLSNCSASVKQVSLNQAISMGRRACKKCY